jgi:putative hydrolase of the HAD superfamily
LIQGEVSEGGGPGLSAVFFDAGGTLLEPRPCVGHIYAEIAGERGLALDPDETHRAFAEAFAEVKARRLAEHGNLFGFSPEEAWKMWWEVLGRTFARMDCEGVALNPLFDRIYEEFASARRFALLEGALETLDTLRGRGLTVGLISNWDHRLHGILRGLDLVDRLDPIIISCDVGVEKPDPAIFRTALQAAGVRPDEALMIGDSPGPDIEGARAAGLWTLLLDTTGWYRGPELRVAHLAEIPGWIEDRFG